MRKKTHSLKKLLWILDTLYKTGGITQKALIDRWEKSPLNDDNESISKRMFFEYKNTIEEIFDVNINCNVSDGYKYYIEDTKDLTKGTVKNWLLTSFSIHNMMMESKQLNNRILYERIPCGNEFLPTIVQAMKDNVCLKISHQGFTYDTPHVFTLKPYGLKVFKQRWYLVGVPHYDKGIKIYALDRIHQLELTEEHFQMPDDFDLSAYFYNLYGVSIDWERFPTDTIRIKAKNTGGYHQVHYLRTLPLHHTQKEVEKHPGYSIFEVRLSPSLDFIYEILSKGDEVEVLSPQWFREEIAGYARAFYQMYKDDIDILNERDQSLQK